MGPARKDCEERGRLRGTISALHLAPPGISATDFTRGQSGYDLEIETDPSNENIVYVASVKDLFETEATIKELNWVSINAPDREIEVEAQIRYRSRPVKGRLLPLKKQDQVDRTYKLIFSEEDVF